MPAPGAVYHIYPVDDLRPHVLTGEACWCEPTRLPYAVGVGIVHKAADGRDLVEEHGVN